MRPDGELDRCHFSPLRRSRYPSATTVRLLLKCGANIDQIDRQRNTPFHVLLRNPCKSSDVSTIIDLFSSHAVHSDPINAEGKTPRDLIPDEHHHLRRYTTTKLGAGRLKCLCAHAIIREQLSYETSLPKSLTRFLEKHSANH